MLETLLRVRSAPYHIEYTAGLILLILGIIAVIWGIAGWLVYRVGKRLDYPHCWLAWVPIGNNWMTAEMSGKENPALWFIGLLLLNIGSTSVRHLSSSGSVRSLITLALNVAAIVIIVLLWSAIAERRGKPSWWGILYIIPIANLVILIMLGNEDSLAAYPQPGYYYPQGYYPSPGYPQQPYPAQEYPGQQYPPPGYYPAPPGYYPPPGYPQQPYPAQPGPQQTDPAQPDPPDSPEPGPDSPPPPP